MSSVQDCLVVGGGVGGLCAAIAFAQRGVAVTLIEKRPDFNVPGVGLGQPACSLRVYRRLGVLQAILDTGVHYGHMKVFDPDYNLIMHHDFQMGGDGLPAFCALSRADLHKILLDRATQLGVDIRMNTSPADLAEVGDKVDVTFPDGNRQCFDLVAGFDGIRSSVREWMVGDMFRPRYSGFGAWRIQVDRSEHVYGMEFLQGTDGKAGVIPIGPQKMYLFNIRPEPEGVFFPQDQMHLLLKDRLDQFGGYVREIAEDLNADSKIVYGALEPHLLPIPWHRGRVTVGGDAAHVVPPHLTAGAAMAAEDGYFLVQHVLDGQGSLDERLTTYGYERFARNAFVYNFARDWLASEQAVRSPEALMAASAEMRRNGSRRIAVADRFLESQVI